ncbi:hypothetical protein BHE74_00002824 [Ensete ventricosum]|nr:hypothetical protein BHE74_00002824 [Ensete ventricosum]
MGRAPCCDKANVKKGPWSPEEDAKLKAYIEEHGTGGNWIALPQKIAQLPGRTDNDIKNYWNTRLKKKLLGKRRQSSQSPSIHLNQAAGEEANGVNHEAPSSQTLSASALERLQLHMQFHGLYHPFSFHNHPASQPRCHPPGDPTPTTLTQQVSPPTPDAGHPQEIDCSALGFHSPSAMETSSSNLDAGLQADLQDLLYCKNSSFVAHEEHQLAANLDYYKDLYGERESTNWCPSNGLEDQSSSMGSWDSASALHSDAMIQEFALRYDL